MDESSFDKSILLNLLKLEGLVQVFPKSELYSSERICKCNTTLVAVFFTKNGENLISEPKMYHFLRYFENGWHKSLNVNQEICQKINCNKIPIGTAQYIEEYFQETDKDFLGYYLIKLIFLN